MAHSVFENQPWQPHQDYLLQRLNGAPVVSAVQALSRFHYVVQRPGKTELVLYLTNKYILSVADVIEILEEAPETNCIASTMAYNQYSPEAKAHCMELGVGLFRVVELLGAVYYDGDRFLAYVLPERSQ
ncbi:MAG TPA: hypothetical protein PLV11_00335 [Phycicoccus elongatus]|jgi:hypothetical protein|nr:hypothetical protein [Phycicoccus elongatus]